VSVRTRVHSVPGSIWACGHVCCQRLQRIVDTLL
jgi:hypothetical protein